MRMALGCLVALLLAACANMGRPGGGPRDELPPKFVRSNPAPGATAVNPSRIVAYFDENVQLEDAFNKVVVSPAQKQPPTVSANGHRITVDFRDTLLPNTTYTIDFADAIKDLNEGNILDGFALDFSTGDSIDTLRISGVVLQAANLEPAQGMLVGVYANLADSAITTLPLERIARTNQFGQFTIRNLPAGEYKIFALNDLNRDYHWDRSEDIAFYDWIISPSTEAIEVTDTLYSSTGADSLSTRLGIRYLPNDVLLTWFNEDYKSHYLADYKRPERRIINITLGAPCDTLPRISIASGAPGIGRDISEWALLQANPTLDTLQYWISDPEVLAADSLRLSVGYQKNDSLDQLVWTSDTLRFFFKEPKKKKDKKKEPDTPQFTVDSISGDTTFLPPPDFEYLLLSTRGGSELGRPLFLENNLPLASLDTAAVRLEIQQDTLWLPVPFTLRPDSLSPLLRSEVLYEQQAGAKYRLTVDTLAAISIYEPHNKPLKSEFTVKQPEEYSNLAFILTGLDSIPAIVELLTSSDEPAMRVIKPIGTDRADIKLITPGKYYARLIIDENQNGKWDTGDLRANVQPEEVYYYSKPLNLKKNWDIEQDWDIFELAADLQKPYAIKKNKPKLKRGEKAPTEEGEEDEQNQGYGRGSSQSGSSMANPFGGFGGRQTNNGGSVLAR